MRKDRDNPIAYDPGAYPGGNDPQPPYYGEPYPAAAYPVIPAVRSRKGIIRLAVFVAVVFVALIVLQTVVFRLQTVYVVGNSARSAEHVAALSGLEKGDSIFAVNEEDVRDSLRADHWIILKHLYKRFPNEVYLFVDEREIVASMRSHGIEYTLDIDGMVMEEYSDMNFGGNVPTVYGFSAINTIVGDFIPVGDDAQLIAYSSIVSELTIQRYADQVVSIDVSDPASLTLLTKSGITVQLGNGDYMRAKVGAMRTDIAYLQQLGKTSGVLDVTVPEDAKFMRE